MPRIGATTLALVSLLLLLPSLRATLAVSPNSEGPADDHREWHEFQEFKEFQARKRRASPGGETGAGRKSVEDDDDDDDDGRRNNKRGGWTRKSGYGTSGETSGDDDAEDSRHRRVHHRSRHDEKSGRRRGDSSSSSNNNNNNNNDKRQGAAGEGRRRSKNKEQKESRGDPPPIDQAALMARYIVNQAAWTSVATISSRKDIKGYPFTNVNSVSDGPLGNGTGIPYLYLTPLDFTAQDVYNDNRATLMMTLAQGPYCKVKDYDPMDPRCARVVLSGKIKEIKESNPEYPTAKSAVFGRHPWLAHMPADHHFFFAKLKIASIAVLDTFGGPKYVTVKDYLNPPNPSALVESFTRNQTIENNAEIFQPMVSMNV